MRWARFLIGLELASTGDITSKLHTVVGQWATLKADYNFLIAKTYKGFKRAAQVFTTFESASARKSAPAFALAA